MSPRSRFFTLAVASLLVSPLIGGCNNADTGRTGDTGTMPPGATTGPNTPTPGPGTSGPGPGTGTTTPGGGTTQPGGSQP